VEPLNPYSQILDMGRSEREGNTLADYDSELIVAVKKVL